MNRERIPYDHRWWYFPLLASLALTVISVASAVFGQAQYAVVRIRSHGGSGTVIQTSEGRSLILSCAHMFKGADRTKRMTFDVPWPETAGPPRRVESRLLAVNDEADLALIQIDVGPLAYVCPVAPSGHAVRSCLSVGFDNMKLPPECRPASIVGQHGRCTYTRESPWHGRSGGALIDQSTGYLVGVVSGYTGSPRNRTGGVYASHSAVLSFLGQGARPLQQQQAWRPAPMYAAPPCDT